MSQFNTNKQRRYPRHTRGTSQVRHAQGNNNKTRSGTINAPQNAPTAHPTQGTIPTKEYYWGNERTHNPPQRPIPAEVKRQKEIEERYLQLDNPTKTQRYSPPPPIEETQDVWDDNRIQNFGSRAQVWEGRLSYQEYYCIPFTN